MAGVEEGGGEDDVAGVRMTSRGWISVRLRASIDKAG